MSWNCPHLISDKCDLNTTSCSPAKGKCVLKGKFLAAEQMIEINRKKTKNKSKNKLLGENE